MDDPFIGEIRMFAGNFAPRGWALCDGQILNLLDNEALYNIIGTTYYRGEGRLFFALPDLRGRVPIHAGQGQGQGPGLRDYELGQRSGLEDITLTVRNMPLQTYTVDISNLKGKIAFSTEKGDTNIPSANNVFTEANINISKSDTTPVNMYKSASSNDKSKDINISGTVRINTGGASQGHTNMQPYVAINYIIALTGILPSRF